MNTDKISKVNLLGLDVYKMNMNDVLELCKQRIASRKQLLLGVVNVAKLVNSQKNEQLRKSVKDADVVLADGLAVVWLSKLIGNPLPERVAGIDIMTNLFESADKMNYRVYFLGAKKSVVEKVVDYVGGNHPGLIVAGYRDGYFNEDEYKSVAQEIKYSNADILFVAMTSPKKEKFLSRWSEYMNIPVCHGVGGSFDVVAGVTKRAPVWMQDIGMEWFYRVLQEPRRMWKRYLVTNSIFAGLALKAFVQARLGIAKP
ncbi:MAG TPA: glycosyltransferase [Desulfobacterales bacterium]|nr:glycosyltransferase [Desulfobacterales bacterium]